MPLEIISYRAQAISVRPSVEGPTWSTLEIIVHERDGIEDTITLHFDDVAGVKLAPLYAAALAGVAIPARAAA